MYRTAGELAIYLRNLCGGYVEEKDTVDKIIIGDPDTVIRKVGTCWMAYFDVIKAAYEAGVNVLICHEPTFYAHHDLGEEITQREYARCYRGRGFTAGFKAYEEMVEEKKQWILEHGMVIIRCHDALDAVKGFGIPFGLGKALGFTDADLLCSERYVNVYRMPERTAFEAAKHFAKQLKPLCQDGVQFYGDPERRVSSVAVGTGCYCDPIELMELGADMYIAIDDTVRTWIQAPYSTDSGLPMIVIHHGTSEEPGVQMLCEHLKTVLTQPVEHFLCGCGYKWISAE